MAIIKRIGIVLDTVATIELNGEELAALDALAGYSHDVFIQTFYEKLGRSYLEPHEAGLRSFLKAVNGCERMTKAADECRKFLALEEKDRQTAVAWKPR